MTNRKSFTINIKVERIYPVDMTYAWIQTAEGWTTATWKKGRWWAEGGWPVSFDEVGFWIDLKALAKRVEKENELHSND